MSACTRARPRPFTEPLETRCLLNSAYFPLVNSPLIQNWPNPSMIQTSGNWNSVPSIEGFTGATLGVSAPGVDPQTVLVPNDPSAPTAVLANLSSPASSSGGGPGEFHLTDPVVALQATPTHSAPHLLFYLNTTGISDPIPVAYTLRDIDDQLTKAIQPVAAQYRIGSAGNFTNIPAAFVADAAGPDGTATKVTAVQFSLPLEASNQPAVQLRIITTDAVDPDEWIGIDNIEIGAVVPQTVQFSSSNFMVNESDSSLAVTITRYGDLASPASVTLSTSDLTATAGEDYTAASQLVQFATGQASKTVSVGIMGDSIPESAERIALTLSGPSGAALGNRASSTVTIIDDDSSAPSGLLINELSVDPPGSVDTPFEFAELRGPASTQLHNVYLVQFEGDLNSPSGKSGVADLVFDLGTEIAGSNGLLMIKAAGGFAPADAGTGVVESPLLSGSADAIENDSQTWLLLFSPIPIVPGQDYDPLPTAGGALQLPAGATILDSVGWLNQLGAGNSTLYTASPITSPQTSIDAATRIRTNSVADDPGAWYFGELADTSGATSLAYDPGASSPNLPANAQLTPGAANYTSSADTSPPTLASLLWKFDESGIPPVLEIEFSEAMHDITLSNAASGTFSMTDLATGNLLPAGNFTLHQITPAKYRVGFAEGGIPASGDYRLHVTASNARDLADNALQADDAISFSFLQGDADGNRRVDTADFNILAGRFGESDARFSTADFSFDGVVDSVDFVAFVASYGSQLPATPPPAPPVFSDGSSSPEEEDPLL